MSRRKILVCRGTGCQAGGSAEIYGLLRDEVARLELPGVDVDYTGCHGFCEQGPIVVVEPEGIFYTGVQAEDAAEIVQSHLRDGKPVKRLFYVDPVTGEAIPRYAAVNFYRQQQRVILQRCGHINPENIDDSLEWGGFRGLKRALLEMTPQGVIQEMAAAGLRGRGGAYATPMRAIPAPSWIAPSWRPIPLPLWKALPLPAMPPAPMRALSMSAPSTPWP